jgi:hypothetical protein
LHGKQIVIVRMQIRVHKGPKKGVKHNLDIKLSFESAMAAYRKFQNRTTVKHKKIYVNLKN